MGEVGRIQLALNIVIFWFS